MNANSGPILAATALDAGSDEALRQGARLARATRRDLVVCHILPEILRPRPLFPQLHQIDRSGADAVRATALSLYEAQRLRVGAETVLPELRLESGTPHAGILAVAEEIRASRIMVGRDSGPEGEPLGRVAETVVRHADVPVLVARAAVPGPVLAATDFSDPSIPAITAAAEEAKRRDVPLSIVHVLDLFLPMAVPPEGYAIPASHEVYEAHRLDAERRLDEIAARVGAATRSLRVGLAADEILAERRDRGAGLLVMGTHGRTGLRRLALGSVAEAVVRRADVPVLIVRLH